MKFQNDTAIFLAARSGSKRLPNKHFLKLNSNNTVIDFCINRLKKSKIRKNIFLCTTKNKEDNKFEDVCKKHKIKIYRGNEKNVLKRFIDCAEDNSIKTIVRITGDCPLIDPKIIDKCINLHFKMKSDYTTNTLKLSFPDGLDVEVINLNSLIKSQKYSKNKFNKEHVTPYIRKSKIFKKQNFQNPKNYSNRRWTLDDREDLIFIKKAVNYFSSNIHFSWKDLIKAEKIEKSLVNIKKRTS
jgi:spore coat polysaccharide biosynthesis protein SpsF (cytidylyltransferase family)